MVFKRTLIDGREHSFGLVLFSEEFTQFLQQKHIGYTNPSCLKHFAVLPPRMRVICSPTLLPLS